MGNLERGKLEQIKADYKKSVQNGSYKDERQELIKQIANFPQEKLMANWKFGFLKFD